MRSFFFLFFSLNGFNGSCFASPPESVSYLAAVQTLIENDAHGPDVHLVGDFGGFLPNNEALGGQVPNRAERIIFFSLLFENETDSSCHFLFLGTFHGFKAFIPDTG